MLNRDHLIRFFKEGYWRDPRYAYRLWRAENRRWGNAKDVWEYIGQDRRHAYLLVDNSRDEAQLQAKGRATAEGLRHGLGIQADHRVLEVGCGVARIGRELAPHCGEWSGCDISSGMIRLARQRTAHLSNVRLQVLSRSALDGYPDDTFDRVYCCVVFMHLDQADILTYVQEMRRVVKPGGIVFYDALNLNSEPGWQRFLWEIEHYRGRSARPIHHSRFATPQEMSRYAEKSGLRLLHCLEPWAWVQIVATKCSPDCAAPADQAQFEDLVRRQVNPQVLGDIFKG